MMFGRLKGGRLARLTPFLPRNVHKNTIQKAFDVSGKRRQADRNGGRDWSLLYRMGAVACTKLPCINPPAGTCSPTPSQSGIFKLDNHAVSPAGSRHKFVGTEAGFWFGWKTKWLGCRWRACSMLPFLTSVTHFPPNIIMSLLRPVLLCELGDLSPAFSTY